MNRDAAYNAIVLILTRHVELDSRYDVANEILNAIWPDEHEHRSMNLDQIRQAVFDGIMDYYGMDEADDDDQEEASDITNTIMTRLGSDEHEHRWWSDSWGQWCQCGASILINPNNPRPP